MNARNVVIYKVTNSRRPVATIANMSAPYGVAMNGSGQLFVADLSKNRIDIFPKGKTTLGGTITDGIANPWGIAIDRGGTLYVSNDPPPSQPSGLAWISEYPAGHHSPSAKFSGAPLMLPAGLAVDGAGDLYIADRYAEQIFEIRKGTKKVRALNLQGLCGVDGVALDSHGNLYASNGSPGPSCTFGYGITVYPPGKTNPSEIISGVIDPTAVCVDAKDRLYVAEGYGYGDVLRFPAGGTSPDMAYTQGINTPVGITVARP
ncbi:MAG TPA: hypothetical protein VJP76_02730 [Candidatus Tumulicola sp.]|nr:hypothetical protein [Candidatus Tumulicola sp.]